MEVKTSSDPTGEMRKNLIIFILVVKERMDSLPLKSLKKFAESFNYYACLQTKKRCMT